MHGLGNDFVILDWRKANFNLPTALITGLADRNYGVGFDQLAIIESGADDAHLRFFNADGSASAACGNATRCIARYLMDELKKPSLDLATDRGVLHAETSVDGLVSVNMGQPLLAWQDIPLSKAMETLVLPIKGDPSATSMGNPHCTFFVDDIAAINLETDAAPIENHPLFPTRTNVQFAQVIGKDHIRMRVWERGVGVTLASGSSSCATAVTAARRGLTGHSVKIDVDGGELKVDWRADGVWLTGPTMHVFSGSLTTQFLDSLL